MTRRACFASNHWLYRWQADITVQSSALTFDRYIIITTTMAACVLVFYRRRFVSVIIIILRRSTGVRTGTLLHTVFSIYRVRHTRILVREQRPSSWRPPLLVLRFPRDYQWTSRSTCKIYYKMRYETSRIRRRTAGKRWLDARLFSYYYIFCHGVRSAATA